MEPYRDSVEHVLHEMRRIDWLLIRGLTLFRQERPVEDAGDLNGHVVLEPEVDAIAAKLESDGLLSAGPPAGAETQTKLRKLDSELGELRKQIDERLEVTEKTGRRLALPHLARTFSLSPAEVDLLLIAMAPELDTRYESLFAYLNDNALRRRPSVALALDLVCRGPDERLLARKFLLPGSQLLFFDLLRLVDDRDDREPTLLRRFLTADEGVVRFLMEQPPTSFRLGTLTIADRKPKDVETSGESRALLENLIQSLERYGTARATIRITGEHGAALAAASAVSNALGRTLIVVNLFDFETAPERPNSLARDATLWDACVAVGAHAEAGLEGEAAKVQRANENLWRCLKTSDAPVFLTGPEGSFGDAPAGRDPWHLDLKPPDFAARKNVWMEAVKDFPGAPDASRLADTFPYSSDRVREIAGLAFSLAALRRPAEPAPGMKDLLEAGRILTAPSLQRFAIPIEPRYEWDDLVLPADRSRQLRAIASRVTTRATVLREWGFGRKLSRGRGLAVLFSGPSGTGKTMAAEVLAAELGLHLFQIDLSSVVSKYIGDTEKNLSSIFREAEMSQSLLFFDEADALYGKRTEVKDAHDRYANIEVNYLLQRIEQYQGLVVLATNFQKNLDEAFLRRLQEIVEFPFPDESDRERIWRGHIPGATPVEDDLDFAFLARQFRFTGGNIRNVVVNAAYLAAAELRPVGMRHLLACVKSEYQKQGRLIAKGDMGIHSETMREVM